MGSYDWREDLLRSKYVDAKDEYQKWLLAVVDGFQDNNSLVQVHFDGWYDKKYCKVP